MNADVELESWRREWSVDTEPLPELKRRVRAQDRRMGRAAVVAAACLAAGTALAIGHPFGSGWGGFAVGLWASSAIGFGWAFWVRRGTWKPEAETTGAYVDLLHRRAIATVRKLVFLRRAALVTLVGYGVFLAWTRHFSLWSGAIVAGLAFESLWMRALEGRRRRDVEAAAALVVQVSQEDRTRERMKQA